MKKILEAWESVGVMVQATETKTDLLISVIIPVYNAEAYIGRCIDSIKEQTYENWELILIDDGSQDTSLRILQEYAKHDTRMHVIHQDNAGPGSARNAGIAQAKGDYIVFVDSDDQVSHDYFELLSKKTEDVVFIDIDQVDENFCVLKTERMSMYAGLSKDTFLRWQMTGKVDWGGCMKAVKGSLLHGGHIGYSKHKIGEEAIYSFLILLNAESYSFIDKPVYKYVNRPGSQSALPLDDPWGEVTLALKKTIVELDLYPVYANTINAFVVTAAIVSLDKMAQKYKYREYLVRAKNRVKKFRSDMDSEYPIDFGSLSKKALAVYPFLKMGWAAPVFAISHLRCLIRGR